MSEAKGLYTPAILAAAMDLTAYPWNDSFALRGTARSRSCGSVVELALALDAQGNVSGIGVRSHACAVGQAAAAIFAKCVAGRNADQLRGTRQSVAEWLAGDGVEPDWPGIELLEPARAYPARHGAILLGWDAALDALAK